MRVTMSIRKVSAGAGYEYLLRSVAKGDGDLAAPEQVTRYYLEAGTPPGFWLGKGLAVLDLALAFGAGEGRAAGEAAVVALADGDVVTAEQLKLLIGAGRHPVTGAKLGRAYRKYRTAAERIDARVARLDHDGKALSPEEYEAAVAQIESEEYRAGGQHAVAGFDLTFSVPKSVSVLWALADANTQARIVEAHHAAVREVLDLLEREVAATRRGTNGIEQADVDGVIAAGFDHWDSRANDPQLHTHVVVSNKVRTSIDRVWRALDGEPLFAATVALSAHYDAVLRDRLTGTFGLGWQRRLHGADRRPQWEIDGIGEDLIAEFSARSAQINAATDDLICEYEDTHGRAPSPTQVGQMRAQATLATRPPKTLHSLHDLTVLWRACAARLLHGGDPAGLARHLTTTGTTPTFTAADVPSEAIEKAAAQTLAVVADAKATWTHWNLWAEASRQTTGWRLATAQDREHITSRIVELAKAGSVSLTPAELAPTPAVLQRPDGTSRLRPKHHTIYTSAQIWAAEQRLLDLAEHRTAPTVGPWSVRGAITARHRGHRLTEEQAAAVEAIASSRRTVDVLVGPAGAGKTTTMRALVTAWQAAHGRGSVIGLAPSAVAAKVLGQDIGLACETTAKWLTDHTHGRASLTRGQLVIVDEATLAGTHTLEHLATTAAEAGAKLLLVGDPHQLQAVEAGGAFAMLTRARTDAPELRELHRFTHAWEKRASLLLRTGNPQAVALYDEQGRVHEGDTDTAADSAYNAWHADMADGASSILVADATAIVTELNRRARADRILAGHVDARRAVELADGTEASVGDVIITRRNARRLTTLRGGFVRNGDRWQVTHIRPSGTIEARRLQPASTPGSKPVAFGSVVLPSAYVAQHINLGYAVTAHRAQGITVDTAHVLVTATMNRENLYVAMTRGRHANHAHVALDIPDDDHAPPPEQPTARAVLYRVLAKSGAELSAHDTRIEQIQRWTSPEQILAEYEHLADEAERPRWVQLVTATLIGAGKLTPAETEGALATDAFGPLCRELRRAEAYGYDVERLLPQVAGQRTLLTAEDVCAVLAARLHRATPARRASRSSTHFVAEGVPAVTGRVENDFRQALNARERLLGSAAAPQSRLYERRPRSLHGGVSF